MFKKILFCTDFSENSDHAFSYASNLATAYNAMLLILHVIVEPVFYYWSTPEGASELIAKQTERVKHLGTSYLERRHQARRLFDTRILSNGDLAGLRIILGDFNEWTRELAFRLLSEHFGSVDVRFYPGWSRTYPGVFPFLRLDHIYFDTFLTLEGATLYRSPKALIASDHLPIVADFHLDNTSSTPGIEGNERKTGKDAS